MIEKKAKILSLKNNCVSLIFNYISVLQMASIEVSLSTTPRRKKGGSISGSVPSPAGHRNRDHYKELDALRVALRDKENIIQTWVIAWLHPWDTRPGEGHWSRSIPLS